jgi:hypothetical protein
MEKQTVSVFEPYPFREGQKITIAGGPRGGDWLVVGVSDRKVKLRCPVSGREFDWDRFCYFVQDRQLDQWPQPDA